MVHGDTKTRIWAIFWRRFSPRTPQITINCGNTSATLHHRKKRNSRWWIARPSAAGAHWAARRLRNLKESNDPFPHHDLRVQYLRRAVHGNLRVLHQGRLLEPSLRK